MASSRYLKIQLGLNETLTIPVDQGDPEGRTFLLGKIPGPSEIQSRQKTYL